MANERTARAVVRRDAPPHRHQGDLAGRVARGLPAAASSEINPAVNAVTAMCVAARAQGSEGRRDGGAPRRGPAAAARPADRHQGSRGDQGPSHHLRLAALSRLRARPRQRHGGPRARRRRGRRRQDQRAGIRRRLEQPQPGVGRHRQSVQSDAQSRRLVGRLGGGARDRHAAGLHRLRHRRLAAQSRLVLRRRRLPPLARHGRGRAPRAWAGRRSRCWARWAAASPMSACSTPRRSASTTWIRSPSRSSPKPMPSRGRSISAACGSPTPRISAARRSRRASAQTFREKIKAMKQLFRRLDKVEVDYGGADRCFDVIRAVSFLSRYQDAYTNNRKMLGPNIIANYELGAKLTLADFAWAHGEQTRIFRALPGDLQGLRPGDRPDGRLHAVPVEAALHRGDGRQEAQQLLPLDGDEVLRHAGHQSRPSRCPAASTTRRCRSACRSSAASAATARCWARPTPWSRRSRPSPASPGRCPTSGSSQADAGAEVDRDPSAEARRQADQGPGAGRALAHFTCAGSAARSAVHRRESPHSAEDRGSRAPAASFLYFVCSARALALITSAAASPAPRKRGSADDLFSSAGCWHFPARISFHHRPLRRAEIDGGKDAQRQMARRRPRPDHAHGRLRRRITATIRTPATTTPPRGERRLLELGQSRRRPRRHPQPLRPRRQRRRRAGPLPGPSALLSRPERQRRRASRGSEARRFSCHN